MARPKVVSCAHRKLNTMPQRNGIQIYIPPPRVYVQKFIMTWQNVLFFIQFRRLEPSAFANVSEAISAVSFSALNINTPVYLPYLLSRFLRFGGHIVRACIQHISQVLEGGVETFTNGKPGKQSVDALVICAGLGARTLGGVEDKHVYPIRGQTVLLRAPWINEGRSLVVDSASRTYIIPRQGGTVSYCDDLVLDHHDNVSPIGCGWWHKRC